MSEVKNGQENIDVFPKKLTKNQQYGFNLFMRYNPLVTSIKNKRITISDEQDPNFIPLDLTMIGTPKDEYIKTRVEFIFQMGFSLNSDKFLAAIEDLGQDIREKEKAELPFLKRIFSR